MGQRGCLVYHPMLQHLGQCLAPSRCPINITNIRNQGTLLTGTGSHGSSRGKGQAPPRPAPPLTAVPGAQRPQERTLPKGEASCRTPGPGCPARRTHLPLLLKAAAHALEVGAAPVAPVPAAALPPVPLRLLQGPAAPPGVVQEVPHGVGLQHAFLWARRAAVGERAGGPGRAALAHTGDAPALTR